MREKEGEGVMRCRERREILAFYPYFLKYLAICPCFEIIYVHAPISKLDFIKIEFQ